MYLKIKKVTMNSKETITRGKLKVVWENCSCQTVKLILINCFSRLNIIKYWFLVADSASRKRMSSNLHQNRSRRNRQRRWFYYNCWSEQRRYSESNHFMFRATSLSHIAGIVRSSFRVYRENEWNNGIKEDDA